VLRESSVWQPVKPVALTRRARRSRPGRALAGA